MYLSGEFSSVGEVASRHNAIADFVAWFYTRETSNSSHSNSWLLPPH